MSTHVPHQSVTITQGIPIKFRRPRPTTKGHANGWWRFGVSLEMYDWLKTSIGDNAGHAEWEEGKGQWVYLGSNDHYSMGRTPGDVSLSFRFRTTAQVMMFKLAWGGDVN